MKQYSEILTHCADYNERTMETGNHFKNGASLKSHTSKKNFIKLSIAMKKMDLFFIGICFVIALWGQMASDYRAKAEKEDAKAQFDLANCYYSGTVGVAQSIYIVVLINK
jgi:TPR repeat protein